MPVNVALLGFGLSGRYLQSPFYAAHPGFSIHHVVTSRAEELAEAYPALRPTADVATAIEDPVVDLVSIATPNATHYEFARAALEAGKHVLVDKPAASTSAQVRELKNLAARQNRHLFVFQNRRWDSDFLTVREILNSNSVGRLVGYEARYDRWKPAPNAKRWKETPGPGAGMLYDLGAHLIDQAIVLFGPPKHVDGHSWTERADSSVPDAFHLWLDYGSHRATLSCSVLVREPTPRYRLLGEGGSFTKFGIDQQEDHLKAGLRPGDSEFGIEARNYRGLLHTDDGRVAVPTLPGNWMALFDNVHQAIEGKQLPAVSLDEVVLQLEIIEACSYAGAAI